MPTLRLGATGDDVVSLQLALVSVGLLAGEPTGQYDNVTARAVVEMQRRAGLQQTGVMDDTSWNALWQMQASVAPLTGGEVTGTPRADGTTELDPVEISGSVPNRGLMFGLAAVAGLVYWYTHKDRAAATAEYDDEDDDEDDEDDDDDEDEEPEHDESALADLDDAVTDSLLDEPAQVSRSGRPGDCKKAAMLLMRRAGLAQRPTERQLYDRVVRKVASDCRGAEDAVEEAIEEAQEQRDEIEAEVGHKLIREASDTAHAPREAGFRKTKFKLTKKTTGSERSDPGVRGRGRRGSSAIEVRRGGKVVTHLRKEKAKTKRGYTWRKED